MPANLREQEVVASYNDNIDSNDDNNGKYCRKCNRSFTRCRDLKRHILYSIAHRNGAAPCYECPLCGKVFTRPDIRKKHQANKSCLDRFFKILHKAGIVIPKNDNSGDFILY